MKKALLIVGGVLLLGVAALAVFVLTFQPDKRAAPEVAIESTPELVARGEYLANHVLGCVECHSKRDWDQFGGPVVGAVAAGAPCLDHRDEMPGKVCAANLTPHESGLGQWTDGEILRALREGVDREGRALFPMMPYTEYHQLADDDAHAVIAYLRSLPPSPSTSDGETVVDFPVSFFIKMAPKPLSGPVAPPDRGNSLEYGKYLSTVAGCKSCHSPVDDKHQYIPGKEFSGGQRFSTRWFTVNTPNLTPHETGLSMNKEAFIARIRSTTARPVEPSQNTLMPWLTYNKMSDEDLGAIHDYLMSLTPIDNRVVVRAQ